MCACVQSGAYFGVLRRLLEPPPKSPHTLSATSCITEREQEETAGRECEDDMRGEEEEEETREGETALRM